MSKMNLNFLKFLSKDNITYLHPNGKKATVILIDKLNLKAGEKILEIGCGTAGTLVEICSKYKVNLFGVDVLEEMYVQAKKRIKFVGYNGRINLTKININEKPPFEDNFFDKVYCESVIGFQKEPDIKFILDEIYRILKSGGKFIANEAIWKKNAPQDTIRNICDNSVEEFGLPPSTEKPFGLDEWFQLFSSCNFEVLSYEDLNELCIEKIRIERNFRIMLSDLFTKLTQFKNLFNISYLRERRRYKVLLKKHQEDGKFLESRLFILYKK